MIKYRLLSNKNIWMGIITHPIYGGLGNQLFQIFAVIALSLKSGHSFFFKYKKMIDDQDTPRHTYWNTFLSKLKPYTVNMDDDHMDTLPDFLSWEKCDIHEPHHEFFEIMPKHIRSSDQDQEHTSTRIYELNGYYQSYKYFENEFNQICDMIGIEEQKQIVRDRVEQIATVAMHFRLGDYKGLQHIHPIMPFEFYRNSLQFILKKLNKDDVSIMIFCDKDDMNEVNETVIARLLPLFPKCEFEYANKDMIEWEHMLLMSLSPCIIMANSTFGMWSAMLNTNPDRIICYTWHWFTELFDHNVKDMFLPHWHKIGYVVRENDGEKYKYKV
jgi:hypothetical protein